MKKLLNRRWTMWLAFGVMAIVDCASVPVYAQRPGDDLPASGTATTDDDAPAPRPRTPAKAVSKPANTNKATGTAAKTAKTRVAAKETTRKTAARTTTGKTVRTGAAKPARATGKVNVPAIFYDKEWSYRTATLYGKDKNIVSSVTGEAKFDRNGKYRQDYYIGSIGNFYKGTYKIQGNRLITYDEKGKKVFDFGFTVGTNPPILVLTLFEKDGSKSIDYSLVPLERNKKP